MISADFHTHTCFSSDSEAKIEDMLDKAVEKGLKTYCITDHYDYMFPQKYKDSFTFSLDDYFDELLRLREKYDKKLDVRIGIEEGYRSEKDIKDEVRMFYSKLADKYDFDFIIGSTHILRGMDPYYKEYWDGVTKEEGLKEYFLSVLDNCENYDNFDVYGHIDYIARVIPGTDKDYNTSDYMDIIDEILKSVSILPVNEKLKEE
jgi:histidinol-phosphatase (PHP family)